MTVVRSDADRLPRNVLSELWEWARNQHTDARPPDEKIGGPDDPYMLRWHVMRKSVVLRQSDQVIIDRLALPFVPENIYVHRFLKSDDDRALHDHPWPWFSVILNGDYIEESLGPSQPTGIKRERQVRPTGSQAIRTDASTPHRIQLTGNQPFTLFATGQKVREWGFWCKKGWRHHKTFTARAPDGRAIGCD